MLNFLRKIFARLFGKRINAENYHTDMTSPAPVPVQRKPGQITLQEATMMNRAARRRLGRMNGIKIPGNLKNHLKKKPE